MSAVAEVVQPTEIVSEELMYDLEPMSSSPVSSAPWYRSPWCDDVVLDRKQGRTNRQGVPALDAVPIELVEHILSFCSLYDLARLRRVSKSLKRVIDQPALYTTVNLHPMPPDGLIDMLTNRLSATRDFTSTSSSRLTLNKLLPRLGANLRVLDLSFSCVQDSMLWDISDQLAGLQELRLRGCRSVRDMASLAEFMPSLRVLDLSWSGVATLPTSEHTLPMLKQVSLSCAPILSYRAIADFISAVASSIEVIDLSHIGIPLEYLRAIFSLFLPLSSVPPLSTSLACVGGGCGKREKKPLRTIDLRGIDLLTRADVRALREMLGPAVEVRSNAVLESDEIDDIRRFVGLWTGLLDQKQAELREAARPFA